MESLEPFLFVLFVPFVDNAFLSCVCITSADKQTKRLKIRQIILQMTLLDFSLYQILAIALVFVWTGFVRTGLGFGGAALGLPLMLFIHNNPLLWLPIISVHLLFFSGLTLFNRLHNVDWQYLRYSAIYIIPAALIGIFGLLNLPVLWLNSFIYSITLFYGFTWLLNRGINSQHVWADRGLLILGGYIAGISLTGAPLMVAVYMRNVSKYKLRDTLFIF